MSDEPENNIVKAFIDKKTGAKEEGEQEEEVEKTVEDEITGEITEKKLDRKEPVPAKVAESIVVDATKPVMGVAGATASVEDVTTFLTQLQKSKVSEIDKSKMITDLSFEKKALQTYAEQLRIAAQEAVARGEKDMLLPAMPAELVAAIRGSATGKEGEGEDLGSSKFMKDMMQQQVQYKMLMDFQKSLNKPDTGEEDGNIIELDYPNGTHYRGPPSLAPHLTNPGLLGQPQQGGMNDALATRLAQIEAALQDPYARQPKVRFPTGFNEDGTPTYSEIPIALAQQYGLLPQQSKQGGESNQEIARALAAIAETQNLMAEQQGKGGATLEEMIQQAKARQLSDLEYFKVLKDVFSPPVVNVNKDTGVDETMLQRARVDAQSKEVIEKEKTKQKQFDTLSAMFGPSEGEKSQGQTPQRDAEEVGKAYLRKLSQSAHAAGGF